MRASLHRSRRMRRRSGRARMIRAALMSLALSGFVCAAANAQDIYRWSMPDGTSLYTDQPILPPGKADRNARLDETLAVPPPDSEEQQQAAREQVQREQKRAEQLAEEHERAIDAADAEVHAADDVLVRAKSELQAGLQPRPGERLGNANGHSRLSGQYWRRVRMLLRAVEEARARLDQAYEDRNAVVS